jgi:hypothetical protein
LLQALNCWKQQPGGVDVWQAKGWGPSPNQLVNFLKSPDGTGTYRRDARVYIFRNQGSNLGSDKSLNRHFRCVASTIPVDFDPWTPVAWLELDILSHQS